jgi:gamma-glutamyltranspeptidase / glutathione hydrolase
MATAEPLDSTGRRNGGLLTGQDLAAWRPGLEAPLTADFEGLTVHKPGPWAQGLGFLQQLAVLSGFDLRAMGQFSPDHLHTVVESAKLAFADREAWYGDPRFADVPIDTLLSADYAAQRRALIGAEASDGLRPGSPDGRTPFIPPLAQAPATAGRPAWEGQLAHGIPAVVKLTEAKGDTCCITVTDKDGNMVAATPSGGWLKSSPVVPGLGFPLGTRGQMASLFEGHPNSLAPGKRPRTTLSPTLTLRDGRPHLAFGTPGGDQQDQWTLNFLLNTTVFGQSPQAAIEALAFHTDHIPTSFTPRTIQPRSVVVERSCPPDTATELTRRGHAVTLVDDFTLGKVCATGVAPDSMLLAAASPRGQQAYGIAR